MQVDFVTLGDAAQRLDVPAPTLRGWADRLEELGIHMIDRNHRDERIFYDSDLEIFRYIKEQKEIYGRKTTTTDLAYVVADKFNCRTIAERPDLTIYRHRPDLMESDIELIVQSEYFKNMMSSIVEIATAKIKENLKVESEKERQAFLSQIKDLQDNLEKKVQQEWKGERKALLDQINQLHSALESNGAEQSEQYKHLNMNLKRLKDSNKDDFQQIMREIQAERYLRREGLKEWKSLGFFGRMGKDKDGFIEEHIQSRKKQYLDDLDE